jgi:hypothetical protein
VVSFTLKHAITVSTEVDTSNRQPVRGSYGPMNWRYRRAEPFANFVTANGERFLVDEAELSAGANHVRELGSARAPSHVQRVFSVRWREAFPIPGRITSCGVGWLHCRITSCGVESPLANVGTTDKNRTTGLF